MKLTGLYTALITPFDAKGALDREGLSQNLQHQLQHHVNGILILGSTGEAPTLNLKEKEAIIKIAREQIKGNTQLIVGTGSYSTEATIASTQQAQDMGADAALIVTPYYNKPTQEGLFRHFAAISEAVSLPICLYNIQGRTGQNLETETLRRLMQFPSIIGVKEASGRILQIHDVIDSVAQQDSPFAVLAGDDLLIFSLMALGGHGAISVASNLIPDPLNKLVKAASSGNLAQARALHYQLLPLFRILSIETNPIPIKAAMQLCGMPAGGCRLPLCDLAPSSWRQLKQTIHSLPFILKEC